MSSRQLYKLRDTLRQLHSDSCIDFSSRVADLTDHLVEEAILS